MVASDDELLASERARFDEVCRFGRERLEPIARTVAEAFADDPIWLWIHDRADTLERDTALPLARLLVAERRAPDEIHGFRDYGAVALWTAPDLPVAAGPAADTGGDAEAPASRDPVVSARFTAWAELMGDRLALTAELDRTMKASHPVEPHWYLGILATLPGRQGQGLGGRLLDVMHRRCDRLGLASFLESSNPRNCGFYRRHGYVETERFSVAGSPPLQGFVRRPRG